MYVERIFRLLHIHESGFRLGRKRKVVAVDEAMLTKRKYNRGGIPAGQQWIFGMIDVETNIAIMVFVPDHTRETLSFGVGNNM